MNRVKDSTNDLTQFIVMALQTALECNLPPTLDYRSTYHNPIKTSNDEYLDRYIAQLEEDIEFWKDKYEVLQLEYYDQVRDSIKRLDAKFERIMFSIDESKNRPLFDNNYQIPKSDAVEWLKPKINSKKSKKQTS